MGGESRETENPNIHKASSRCRVELVSANLDKTLHGLQRKTSVSRGLCRKDPTIDG